LYQVLTIVMVTIQTLHAYPAIATPGYTISRK
jgi:hypothetical protein